MSFLITDALAAAPSAAAVHESNITSILLMVGFILIFYFMLWRPQAKRAKEQRNLLNSLAKGDEVVTAGGILGKISQISDDFISLTISEGVEIKIQKPSIVGLLPKGTLKLG